MDNMVALLVNMPTRNSKSYYSLRDYERNFGLAYKVCFPFLIVWNPFGDCK